MNRRDFEARWSELHGGASIHGATKKWLYISFTIAKLLSRIKLTPNALTILTIFLSIPIVLQPTRWWSLSLAILAFLSDGVDGSLAIITRSESRWGALLDSFADRINEGLWLAALYLRLQPFCNSHPIILGALSSIWLATTLQEYMRARAQGLGFTHITIVTVMERPVRAILTFIFIGGLVPLYVHFVTRSAWQWVTSGGDFFLIFLAIFLILQVVSIFQLTIKYYGLMQGAK